MIVLFSCFFLAANFNFVEAKITDWQTELDKGVTTTNVYNMETVKTESNTAIAIAKYIGAILSTTSLGLGLWFIIRIIMAGYEWMTADGNSEKIETAQKRIKNAIIGALIFAILYLLAYFFITNFAALTGYKI